MPGTDYPDPSPDSTPDSLSSLCKACATFARVRPDRLHLWRCKTPGCPRFTLGDPLPPPLDEEPSAEDPDRCECGHSFSRSHMGGKCCTFAGCDCKIDPYRTKGKGKSGKDKPPPGTKRVYVLDGHLLVKDLTDDLRAEVPVVLTQEFSVALYDGGVYGLNPLLLQFKLGRMLGNDYSPAHIGAAEKFLSGELHIERRVLSPRLDRPLLNVRNGMVDLVTGDLLPHSPDYLTAVQFPVDYDPTATCPVYEAWGKDVIPDQIDDLEEVISTMLDPSRTPPKALLLYGPSRSGKSTLLRIMARMVGGHEGKHAHVSAVTLHQLATDRFASANVYGAVLNVAADLAAGHVEDLSVFKVMTGDDPVQANRKYGRQFTFVNRALFAFSANTVPTVGEASRAYVERMKPFQFSQSFAGREDPEIEAEMIRELPGILNRWVRGWQRMHARGGYAPTDPDVLSDFITRSNRVQMFVKEACTVHPAAAGDSLPEGQVMAKRHLREAFRVWGRAAGENVGQMGERKFVDVLLSIDGVEEVRVADGPHRGVRGLNITVNDAWA